MSIPVFGDVTQVLMAPLAAIIAKRKKMSMSTMATWTTSAASLTHSMIPPTPGILAVTIMLGADVGFMIFWSIIISAIAYFGAYFLLGRWVSKEWIDPRPDYVMGVEPAQTDDYRALLVEEKGLPSVFTAALPILLPVVLIAGASFAGLWLPKENSFRIFMAAVGERNIAMFIGALICIVIGFSMKDNIIKNYKINTGEDNKDISDIILNKWVIRALTIALLPLLITAMGGGFSSIIRAYPDISKLGELVVQYNFPTILVPWIIAAVMMIAVGSRTTAGMTSAAIVLPMAGALGLTPLQLALIIGSGTLVGTHVSDSGFWVGTQLYNLNVKHGIKYLTFIQAVMGVISLIAISIFMAIGIV
jgi:GntP family gluconate:H+ symporter